MQCKISNSNKLLIRYNYSFIDFEVGVKMIENDDVFNKVVGLVNLTDAHFKVLVDNQNLILKNQSILSKQMEEINSKLDKLLEE